MTGLPLSKVEITGTPPVVTVKVNGHMLACSSASLHLDAETLPVLTVTLPVADDIVVTLDGVQADVTEATRQALTSMGWTEPQ
jgi:hypothetical protein